MKHPLGGKSSIMFHFNCPRFLIPLPNVAPRKQAGANGSFDKIKNHEAPWGIHRQGGFIDPFGHIWLLGNKSPLKSFP